MAGHGVEEHAVHVEEGGSYGKGVERVAGCGGFVAEFRVRVPIVGEGGGIVWVIHRWELKKKFAPPAQWRAGREKEGATGDD